jgi:DNA-directed RNA polymerase specialized sigma subunit
MRESNTTAKDRNTNKRLDEISKKLDIMLVTLLARSELTRKEIADVLGISEDTIERMLPFRKLKSKRHKE